MARIIIRDPSLTREEIDEIRLIENLALTPLERFRKAFVLMEFAAMFSKDGIIKKPQGKGIVLKVDR